MAPLTTPPVKMAEAIKKYKLTPVQGFKDPETGDTIITFRNQKGASSMEVTEHYTSDGKYKSGAIIHRDSEGQPDNFIVVMG